MVTGVCQVLEIKQRFTFNNRSVVSVSTTNTKYGHTHTAVTFLAIPMESCESNSAKMFMFAACSQKLISSLAVFEGTEDDKGKVLEYLNFKYLFSYDRIPWALQCIRRREVNNNNNNNTWNVKANVIPVLIWVSGTISKSPRLYLSNIPG